jgi:hypothetical protein
MLVLVLGALLSYFLLQTADDKDAAGEMDAAEVVRVFGWIAAGK